MDDHFLQRRFYLNRWPQQRFGPKPSTLDRNLLTVSCILPNQIVFQIRCTHSLTVDDALPDFGDWPYIIKRQRRSMPFRKMDGATFLSLGVWRRVKPNLHRRFRNRYIRRRLCFIQTILALSQIRRCHPFITRGVLFEILDINSFPNVFRIHLSYRGLFVYMFNRYFTICFLSQWVADSRPVAILNLDSPSILVKIILGNVALHFESHGIAVGDTLTDWVAENVLTGWNLYLNWLIHLIFGMLCIGLVPSALVSLPGHLCQHFSSRCVWVTFYIGNSVQWTKGHFST